MKSIKRGIAVLLAALLLTPNMPAKADQESLAGVVQFNTGSGVCMEMTVLRRTAAIQSRFRRRIRFFRMRYSSPVTGR